MPELAQRITEYAASVHEANKRTLDPIIIELMRDLRRTNQARSPDAAELRWIEPTPSSAPD